jgi:hypothetical protein
MMEGQRPCSDTIVPYQYGNISLFNTQLIFPVVIYNSFAAFYHHLIREEFNALSSSIPADSMTPATA